jgi:hypothetical protein
MKLQQKYYGSGKKPEKEELVEYNKKKSKMVISFTGDFAVSRAGTGPAPIFFLRLPTHRTGCELFPVFAGCMVLV